MDKESQNMNSFIDGIKNKLPMIKLSMHLSGTSKDNVLKWVDDKGFDIMHNCIVLNSPEAAEYLLTHGYFVEPHQPKANPYLHLASKLGHRTIMNVILTHRHNDFKATSLLVYPDGDVSEDNSKSTEITPLDVAAEEKQMSCVHLLLTQCVVKANAEFGKSGFVTLSTVANSQPAVKLLLKDKPKKPDIEEAIHVALYKARPECLDILLSSGIKTDKMFDGVNFYHILFTFSPTHPLGNDCYERLPAVTSVLIKHKHDVNVKLPTNTYPLYSLVCNSICLRNFTWNQYYLECIRLLLKAGANPTFDEAKYEALLKRKGKKSIMGRYAYSSALHCLMETVEDCAETLDPESKSVAIKYIVKCADFMVQNGAKINQAGRIGDPKSALFGTVLQQYAKTSANIGVEPNIIRFLLREGGDPSCAVKGKYVLNTFADILFSKIRAIPPHIKQPDYTSEIKHILQLCEHMTRDSINQTLQVFKKDHGRNPSPHIEGYVKFIIKELEDELKKIRPLNKLVADYIWNLCRRNANVVHSLQISAKYKTQILPIM